MIVAVAIALLVPLIVIGDKFPPLIGLGYVATLLSTILILHQHGAL